MLALIPGNPSPWGVFASYSLPFMDTFLVVGGVSSKAPYHNHVLRYNALSFEKNWRPVDKLRISRYGATSVMVERSIFPDCHLENATKLELD